MKSPIQLLWWGGYLLPKPEHAETSLGTLLNAFQSACLRVGAMTRRVTFQDTRKGHSMTWYQSCNWKDVVVQVFEMSQKFGRVDKLRSCYECSGVSHWILPCHASCRNGLIITPNGPMKGGIQVCVSPTVASIPRQPCLPLYSRWKCGVAA